MIFHRVHTNLAQTLLLSMLVLASVSACGDDEVSATAIDLRFDVAVGDETFTCGQDYTGLGSTASTLNVSDLRMYIHDVRFVTDSGEEVALELDPTKASHGTDVTLFDFAGDTCGGGEVFDSLTARVPAGRYKGIRFKLGVPFDLNHQDAAVADAPLNLTAMFWNWNGGYKFIRIDGETTGVEGWRFHLGSTGCDGDMRGNVTTCTQPNRPEIDIENLDFVVDGLSDLPVVTMDLAALVNEVDLDTFTPETPKGCMGGAADPDCEGYFANLGLAWGTSPATKQTVFAAAQSEQ